MLDLCLFDLDWLVWEVFSDDFLSDGVHDWLHVDGHGFLGHHCELGSGFLFFDCGGGGLDDGGGDHGVLVFGLVVDDDDFLLGLLWTWLDGEDELGGILELCGLDGGDGLGGGDFLRHGFLDEGNHFAGDGVSADEFGHFGCLLHLLSFFVDLLQHHGRSLVIDLAELDDCAVFSLDVGLDDVPVELTVAHLAVGGDDDDIFSELELLQPQELLAFDFLMLAGELLQGHVLVELSGNSESPPDDLAVGEVVVESDDLLAQILGLLGLVVHGEGQGHSSSAVLVDQHHVLVVAEVLAHEFHWLGDVDLFFDHDVVVFEEVAQLLDLLLSFFWELIDELLFHSFEARHDGHMFLDWHHSWLHDWHHSWSDGDVGFHFFDHSALGTSYHSCDGLFMGDFIGEDHLHFGASAFLLDLCLFDFDWLVWEVFSDDFLGYGFYNWLYFYWHGFFSDHCEFSFFTFWNKLFNYSHVNKFDILGLLVLDNDNFFWNFSADSILDDLNDDSDSDFNHFFKLFHDNILNIVSQWNVLLH